MNPNDAFWTLPITVNHGMTIMPAELRFETLSGTFLQNQVPSEAKYRIWINAINQPTLLFASMLTGDNHFVAPNGPAFPSLFRSLVDAVSTGYAAANIVNEDAVVASLFIQRTTPSPNASNEMALFVCRMQAADDATVVRHLSTLVLSLRRERDTERNRRLELECEVKAEQPRSTSSPEIGGGHPDPMRNFLESLCSEAVANVPSRSEAADDDGPGPSSHQSVSPFEAYEAAHSVATLALCALCPRDLRKAVPDENSVIKHIANEHINANTCNGCPVRTEVQDLQSHIRMHIARIYACMFCGKQGSKKNVLKAHLRTHTGEKPYSCPMCDRKFSDASTLRRHRTIHTGEMATPCPLCERIITRRDNIKAHLRNNHGVEWTQSMKDFDPTTFESEVLQLAGVKNTGDEEAAPSSMGDAGEARQDQASGDEAGQGSGSPLGPADIKPILSQFS